MFETTKIDCLRIWRDADTNVEHIAEKAFILEDIISIEKSTYEFMDDRPKSYIVTKTEVFIAIINYEELNELWEKSIRKGSLNKFDRIIFN